MAGCWRQNWKPNVFASAIMYVLDANLLSNYNCNLWKTNEVQTVYVGAESKPCANTLLAIRNLCKYSKRKKNHWTSWLWFRPGPYEKWPISRILQHHLSFWWHFFLLGQWDPETQKIVLSSQVLVSREILLGCLQSSLWNHAIGQKNTRVVRFPSTNFHPPRIPSSLCNQMISQSTGP